MRVWILIYIYIYTYAYISISMSSRDSSHFCHGRKQCWARARRRVLHAPQSDFQPTTRPTCCTAVQLDSQPAWLRVGESRVCGGLAPGAHGWSGLSWIGPSNCSTRRSRISDQQRATRAAQKCSWIPNQHGCAWERQGQASTAWQRHNDVCCIYCVWVNFQNFIDSSRSYFICSRVLI